MLIRDLLNNKSDILLTALPDTYIREATGLMTNQWISALMVLSKDDSLTGIRTERDVALFSLPTGQDDGARLGGQD